MTDIKSGLEILLDGPQPALWDRNVKRETLRFLRKCGEHIRGRQLDHLVEAILRGPPRQMDQEDPTNDDWNKARDHQILLRLHKLMESGASLPVSAQETYDRIQSDQPWQPRGDHSEEFALFVSSGTGAYDLEDAGALENFEEMSNEKFIEWSGTQTGERILPWECSGGWHLFVENDIRTAVKLLRGASDAKVWPIPPWCTVLGAFEKNGQQNVTNELEQEVANLLIGMPRGELTILALQTARWLEDTRSQLGKTLRRKLWQRIWEASLEGEEPEGELDLDMTLNHAGGILGEILYAELSEHFPSISAGQNPGIPNLLQRDFECLAENDHPSAKLARVRLAPTLFALYRIDPDWVERTFFCRMDPDNLETFDPYLWEGYFWYARCSTDLLAAFKPLLLGILKANDRIPEQVRCNAVTSFIYLAVPPDRGIDIDEAKGVLWALGPDGLADAATALRDTLQGAGDKSPTLWRDTVGPWFEKAWPKRPEDRSPDLSENLTRMAIDAGDAFPHVADAIKDVLVPENWSRALFNFKTEEKNTGLVSRYPHPALILVDKLFHDGSDRELLSELLEAISVADPKLKKAVSFKRLAAKVHVTKL